MEIVLGLEVHARARLWDPSYLKELTFAVILHSAIVLVMASLQHQILHVQFFKDIFFQFRQQI